MKEYRLGSIAAIAATVTVEHIPRAQAAPFSLFLVWHRRIKDPHLELPARVADAGDHRDVAHSIDPERPIFDEPVFNRLGRRRHGGYGLEPEITCIFQN